MKHRIFRVIFVLIAVATAAFIMTAQDANYRTALTPDGQGIARRPGPLRLDRGVLSRIPEYQPGKTDTWQVDLRGCDLSTLELNGRVSDLLMAHFDDRTRWPSRLPESFDPARIMEIGRNPGLGIWELHKRSLTGKGVGIAIIDQALLVDHIEYKDRLRLYEEIHCVDEVAPMHGAAVASIAVGKTVGVAPEADLYYIAETHGTFRSDGFDWDFTHLARSIDRVLEVNRRLPDTAKIRAISISVAWNPGQKGFAETNAAVDRARKENVFVINVSMRPTYGFEIFCLGRDPRSDPDAPTSYGPPWWGASATKALCFPVDSRTTASPTGTTEYVFYRLGGISWAAPWAAGLYTIACQVSPEITPEIFWTKALETSSPIEVPSSKPVPSEEELRKQVDTMIGDQIARMKEKSQGRNLEEILAQQYTQITGKKTATMSEADFRIGMDGIAREFILRSTRPFHLSVVNPARLIEAIRNRS